MFLKRCIFIAFLLALVTVSAALAQEETVLTYSGYLDSQVTMKEYPLDLLEGQAVLITAEATSGDLDTMIYLLDPDGSIVGSNDDRSDETLDSALGYLVLESGSYTLQMTRYDGSDTSGNYDLRITIGDESILDELDSLTRIQLSGTTQTLDTPHFRIHYTFEGSDAITQSYLDAVALTVEEVWSIEIEQMGWPPPPQDGVLGGDNRYDVYLVDLIGSGEGALGYASPESIVGDNPNTTEVVEEYAGTSYLAVENDFDDVSGGTAISLMRATFAHEFHHAIQFGYDVNDDHDWYYEATATWMETAAVTKDEDGTGYVSYTYEYPELCFGTETDPGDGQMMYGEWPFIQMLVDMYGDTAVRELWANIGKYEGFEALEHMLEPYSATLPFILASYRVKNLARDYVLAPEFGATVWLENTITDVGRWTFTGEGIQELGANYFRVDVEPAVYYAGLVNDGGSLELWAVGVTLEKLEAMPLGRGGNFDTSNYDDVYLLVFNPIYDEDINDCTYYNYDIDLTTAKGLPGDPLLSFPAEHYEPLS